LIGVCVDFNLRLTWILALDPAGRTAIIQTALKTWTPISTKLYGCRHYTNLVIFILFWQHTVYSHALH